ncbi:MAG: hypothetical protein KAH08_05800 [Methylococcales bacterium]|nr:hypothetical protein [Methylococcales bacterium]
MKKIEVNLHDCKHCDGSGTCKNGKDGCSCVACAKKNELSFWKQDNQFGLLCGSCGGIGRAEPLTERIHNRVAPLLAIYLVCILLGIVLLAAMSKNQFFSELLAFSSAIIGSVVGYYFSSKGE